ncbi:MAG: MarC family protein [Chloroflexi bacterium]|nr:MarC family protein [Chloroflexota bacterium]
MTFEFPHDFLYEFITLFAVLDPTAAIPVFLTVTAGLSRKRSLLVAAYAVGVAFLVLFFFIAVGQFLLEALKIPMASFQLAGSLVLLLFGLKLVLGQVSEEAAAVSPDAKPIERAIFPLAIPSIAGAGAMLTVVLLTDNRVRSLGEQVTTTGILVLCLAIIFCILAASTFIFRIIGRPGIEILSRVSGLVLASIGVNGIMIAIKMSFVTA